MTPFRNLSRFALDGSLRAARAPWDAAAKLTGREEAALRIDRLDATVREVAGTVLADETLRADAARRRIANDERVRAFRLRTTAEAVTERADDELAAREAQAERAKQEAAAQAQRRKAAAAKKAEAEKRRAREDAERRKRETEEAAARAKEAIDEEARRERLEALEEQHEALEVKQDALAAKEEAQRLKRAAAEAKTARKS
jgi:hypothetical protein